VNCETRALLEQWDFYAKNIDEACDFLDWLGWDTYEFETSCFDSYIPPPYIPNYAPPMCGTCCGSNHDSNSCRYYISDSGFVRLTSMIEIINEQQVEFASKM